MRKKDADQKRAEAPRGKKKWIIIAVVAVVLIAAAEGIPKRSSRRLREHRLPQRPRRLRILPLRQ